jgi:prepilin-type N-terminal cleavage/methylation domain-containing protein
MKLFNELTKIKKEGNEMKNKKKKGFTLIELIAVIAILAILGAIIIPNVLGYTAKANAAKYKADANILMNAINSYNADSSTTVPISVISGTAATGTTNITSDASTYMVSGPAGFSNLLSKMPSEYAASTISLTQLQGIADGTIQYGTTTGFSLSGTSIVIN